MVKINYIANTECTPCSVPEVPSSVTPEISLSYESGTMTAAEAGRHTVITGYVTAALLNQDAGTEGKYFYLALDEKIRQEQ